MTRILSVAWWYWLVTVFLLAWEVTAHSWGAEAAIALCLLQILHFGLRKRSLISFPLQVRIGYLALLLLALWPPLGFIYWIQLVGTSAMVLVNYCFLARCLALLPWNRSQPLTASRLVKTFFSAPVTGSVADH